jgi:adenylate kinase
LCDVCGGDVIQREDDTEDAINARLDGYETQTRPLIDFYFSRGLLVTVSGVGTPDEVLVRLISAIESRRRGPAVVG